MQRRLFYDPNSLRQLTPRESIVLSAAKKNQPVDDIADTLQIPQSTVVRHLSNIVNKLAETDKKMAHKLLFSYNLEPRS